MRKYHPFLPVQRGNLCVLNRTFIDAHLHIAENCCKWHSLTDNQDKPVEKAPRAVAALMNATGPAAGSSGTRG